MIQSPGFSEKRHYFLHILQRRPSAEAAVKGGAEYPSIRGRVSFYQTEFGVLVYAEVSGLPTANGLCEESIFAFHIHSGDSCTGNPEDPFSNTLGHYNPDDCAHPNHAGDMIPLFDNRGYAFEVFLTDRFSLNEIIGKTVVIHRNPDDFVTQPSGNAGRKIACGEILRCRFDSLRNRME